MKKTLLTVFTLLFLSINLCYAQQKTIAITIDDLPLIKGSYADFENIVNSFVKHQVPAIGFVIGDRLNAATVKQLELFQKNGLMLGNHTYSHRNLRHVSSSAYMEDIAKADALLAPFMSSGPKYFRYPYLGQGLFWQKGRVHHYLNENHYIIAPITIDSRDFEFETQRQQLIKKNPTASLADLKKRYIDYVWQRTLTAEKNKVGHDGKQILLIHVNLLNSNSLDDLLQMFEDNGYHFISITEALKP